MKRLRATWRGLRAGAVTAGAYLTWLVGHGLLCVAPRARPAWRRRVMRRWCQAMCWALGVRVERLGRPPAPGAFVVCNHLSYLDVVVLGGATDTVFVSKAEVADWPVIGSLARQFGTIFLTRERKRDLPAVNVAIRAALARGEGVVVFPEGTSTKGEDVLTFRPSLLAPAADGVLEVVAAAVSYRTAPGDPPASLSVCWWGDMPFTPHVRELLQLERVEALLEFDPEPIRSADRKDLAEKLLRKVKSRFRPVP